MFKKMILAASLFGLSMNGALATSTLNFNGTYAVPNELNLFYFVNSSVGDVQIVVDTLTDGFDADMTVWEPTATPNASLPNGHDWALLQWVPDGGRPSPETGLNDFGISFKNGYIPNDPFNQGTSDPGVVLQSLEVGTYLIAITGVLNSVNNFESGDLMSGGFAGFDQFNLLYSANPLPRVYTLAISGDVSEVPVPAAVWLLGTALAGLGYVRKRNSPILT